MICPGAELRVKPLSRDDALCPNCDAVVSGGALSCPNCGSDSATGWSDEASDWAGDLPSGYGDDDEFDYDAALEAEGLAPPRSSARGRAEARRRALIWLAVALAVLALVMSF